MTPQDYTNKENRLKEIEKRLKEISESDSADMQEVISLRAEGRKIAEELQQFIKENFEK